MTNDFIVRGCMKFYLKNNPKADAGFNGRKSVIETARSHLWEIKWSDNCGVFDNFNLVPSKIVCREKLIFQCHVVILVDSNIKFDHLSPRSKLSLLSHIFP